MIPVVVALILTLVTTVSVAFAQQGRPETQAFLVKDINDTFDTAAGSSPGPFVEAGGTVFFIADDGTSAGLWRTDGTPAGTVMVKAFRGRTHSLFNFNGTLYFASEFSPFSQNNSDDKLWKSDGTAEGTVLVAGDTGSPPPPRPKLFSGFTVVKGTVFFVSKFDIQWTLWKSDGTTAGTVSVATWRNWSPFNLTAVGGTLFFTQLRPDIGVGIELWKSDGTEAGTVLVKDINPGAGWSSPSNLTDVNGTLFFTAFRPDTGYELWKSDGTEQGTVLVKDLNAGPGDSSPMNLASGVGKLFFSASLPSTGREPWTSDGTEAGTVLLKNINLGAGSSSPGELTRVGSTLFFTAIHPDTGSELWKSDGTEAGTVLVKDIDPGPGSSLGNFATGRPTEVNGILFFAAFRPDTGWELWKSDGTDAGTVLVKDIVPGAGYSLFGTSWLSVNGTLFFSACHPDTGCELWKSDGTEQGTVLVKDINPGPAGAFVSNLTNV